MTQIFSIFFCDYGWSFFRPTKKWSSNSRHLPSPIQPNFVEVQVNQILKKVLQANKPGVELELQSIFTTLTLNEIDISQLWVKQMVSTMMDIKIHNLWKQTN
jgi:hypothetical protein